MAAPSSPTRWLNGLVLIAFGWLAVLLELAPLNEEAGALPAPDLLFCVCAYFALRRPTGTPAVLVGLMGLVRDLISGGPVGLGALTLLAGVETVRSVSETIRRRGLAAELLMIAIASVGMIALNVLALVVTFSPIPDIMQLVLRAAGTLGAYVLIYLFMRFIMRVRDDAWRDRSLSSGAG
ncbi:MAG: rod shape-determining protein MreD [Pseudomonadota bacterium]